MAMNTGATAEQITPYINRLLEQCGMFPLPEGTTAANILDRLNVLFSQIDGKSDNTVDLSTRGGTTSVEIDNPESGLVAMSNRLRSVTPKEREIQNRAAELARSRRISYFRALEIVRGIRG